jgi:hypothetical protein
MSEIHGLHSLGYVLGLLGIKRAGTTSLYVAEMAVPCARVSQDKKGSRAIPPTFTDVRTVRLLADGMELLGPHQSF